MEIIGQYWFEGNGALPLEVQMIISLSIQSNADGYANELFYLSIQSNADGYESVGFLGLGVSTLVPATTVPPSVPTEGLSGGELIIGA